MTHKPFLFSTFCLIGLTAIVSESWAQPKAPSISEIQDDEIRAPKIRPKSTQSENNADLLDRVDEAIAISSRRYLSAKEHSPWQIYHGLNAFRRDFQLDMNGELISAIDWLSTTNPHFRGTAWFEKTVHGGRAHRYTEPYHFEGHPNQSLALMVMCNLPKDHTFQTDDGPITVQDIINNAKADLNDAEELTWTLWFLTHYLDSEETWKTRRGETWNIEKLVYDQIQTQVNKAACGGTHNLYSLAVARNNHLRRGGQLRGVWIHADQKIKRYLVAARSIQRRDGSFPTNYFRGYGYPKTFSEQIASSGHMMEWIVVAVDDRQLDDEWVERGIEHLCNKLTKYHNEEAECGPLYHAVSALLLYRERLNEVPWPRPDIQTESIPVVNPMKSFVETPNIKKSLPDVAAPAELKKPVAELLIDDMQDELANQAQSGKVTAGIDTPGLLRQPEPDEAVEILVSPKKETIVK